MAEKVARLSDEQWGAFEAALDGEIADLKAEVARLEAEAAPLWAALEAVEVTVMRLRSDANLAQELGYDGGNEMATAKELEAIIQPALSSDAGKGWVPPDKVVLALGNVNSIVATPGSSNALYIAAALDALKGVE